MNHHLKYILTATCGLALSMGTASAAKTGFYAGPVIGGSWVHTTNNVVNDFDGRVAHSKKNPNAFLAGALAGWGLRSGCLYGAVEFDGFYADISQTLISNVESQGTTKQRFTLKNKYQLGGGIRFGYVQPINTCTSIMPFVRLGFQVGKYERKYLVTNTLLPGGKFTKKGSTNVFSVVPAIGAELTFKDKYSFRIEGRYAPRFTHQLYTGTIKNNPNNVIPTFENSTLYTAVSQRALLVSAIYHI